MPIGPFRNIPNNFNLSVSAGQLPGFDNFFLTGVTPVITAIPTDIWGGAGDYPGQPTSNLSDIIAISSTNSLDNLGGTGAHAYTITGLKTVDSQFYETEMVLAHPTDGQLDVFSAEKWYRVTVSRVVAAGVLGTSAGTITASHQTVPANIFSVINPPLNRSMDAVYTVPANNQLTINGGYITARRLGGNLNGAAVICTVARVPGILYQCFQPTPASTDGGAVNFFIDDIVETPPGTDFKFTVLEVSNLTDIICSAFMNFTIRNFT